MPLNDFANRDEAEEQKELQYYKHSFILRPEYWESYANPTPLTWQRARADKAHANEVPDDKMGVYSFVIDTSTAAHPGTRYLLYIGKAEDQPLRQRFNQYLVEADNPKGRPLIVEMFKKWPAHLWFYFATVDPSSAIPALEDDLIGAFAPPQNDVLPVEIRRPVKVAWRK